MNWEEIGNTIVNFFTKSMWSIIGFFVTLVLGAILVKVVLYVLKKILRKRGIDETAVRFVAAIVRLLLIIVIVLILLWIIGIPITGLTTAFSAAVLAIGVALKEFLANVASGIILVASGKYKTGDFVQVNGSEGMVEDINFLFTTLRTPARTQITLPNSMMVNNAVTNFGAYSTRRVGIIFSVAYESDTDLVRKTMVDVMKSCGLVYSDPAPSCRLKNLGESSIDFWCTCFCDNSDYWDVYYYVMDHGFDECKRVGIQFPFKQIELTQKKEKEMPINYPDGLPERVEKTREKTFRKASIEELEDMDFHQMQEYYKESNAELKKEKEKNKAAKQRRKEERKAQKLAAKKKKYVKVHEPNPNGEQSAETKKRDE